MVLFNGMDKTSHWAALYFVALMTFGNYVLFNLLVAILVEGFSSEVSESLMLPSACWIGNHRTAVAVRCLPSRRPTAARCVLASLWCCVFAA